MSKRGECTCKIVLFIIGLIFIGLAVAIYIIGNNQIEKALNNFAILRNGSNSVKTWSLPPAQIYRNYYFFEVNNPNELQTGQTSIPNITQRGPYVYEEIMKKTNIMFSENGLNVSYTPVFELFFVPELSVGSDNDSFMFLNIPFLAVTRIADARISQIKPTIAQTLAAVALNLNLTKQNVLLFENRTVADLIEGYTDFITDVIKQQAPGILKGGKFSLLNGKNGTEYQNFTVGTGTDNIKQLGKILEYDGKESLSIWFTDQANMINGSDGFSFGPYKEKTDIIQIFNSDLCRSFDMVYLEESKINNIKTIDFHMKSDIFANSTINPANEGFCNSTNDNCSISGIFNTQACNTIPIILSQPHFLNADQSLIDSVVGIKPNSSLHDSVLRFEPLIGVPVSGNIRVQFNFQIKKSLYINAFKSVKEFYLPVGWFEKQISLDKPTEKLVKTVTVINLLIKVIPFELILVGSIFIVISIFLATCGYTLPKDKRNQEYNMVAF